jgi:hypothetical protein
MPEDSNFEVASAAEFRRRYGLTADNRPTIILDPQQVPGPLRGLIPLAEYWGIRDDLIREDLVDRASSEQLVAVKTAVRAHEDELMAWLTSSDETSRGPSEAYVAFSNLLMVADSV